MSLALAPPPTRRLGGLAFVVALHVVIIYALATGLGRQAIEVLKAPLETTIIKELKAPPPDTPPPPPPKLAPPPPTYIPAPEVMIRAAPSANAIAAVTTVKQPEPAPAPAPVAKAEPVPAVHVPPVITAARCRKPEYPAASTRLEEEGVTRLLLLVGTSGQVTEARVEVSSGHKRLDDAALAAFSSCKFDPGTVDGKAEEAWGRIDYRWKLQ